MVHTTSTIIPEDTMSKKTPEHELANGKPLKCLVCGNDTFYTRKGQINTAAMSFLDLDFLNKTATCRVCGNCGYVHWFLER